MVQRFAYSRARMVQRGPFGSRLILLFILEHDRLSTYSIILVVHIRDIVYIGDRIVFQVELVEDIGGEVAEVRFVVGRTGGRRGGGGVGGYVLVVIVHVRNLGQSGSRFRLV